MAAVCSHQDQSRNKVSATALLIAFARSLETEKEKDERLFCDPFAAELAGDLGKSSIALAGENEEEWSPSKKNAFLRAITTRTKIIDDFIVDSICNYHVEQIIVLGAGLDTRPWRLHPNIADLTDMDKVKYFEVDFPEVFDYKLSILNRLGAVSDSSFDYHNVVADLSVPEVWPMQLAQAGFSATSRTLWVMEGFCNYLTEEELCKLMSKVFEISAEGSRLVSTFLTPQSTHVSLKLHQFYPENPIQFMSRFGWSGRQDDVEDLSVELSVQGKGNREHNRGYYIVRLYK
jgi:methyltransferase (TIGR00027 family)